MESIPAVEPQTQSPVNNTALRLNAVETDDDWLLVTSGDMFTYFTCLHILQKFF